MGAPDLDGSRRHRAASVSEDFSMLNEVPRFWKWLALTLVVVIVILGVIFVGTLIIGVIRNDPTFTQMAAGAALAAVNVIP